VFALALGVCPIPCAWAIHQISTLVFRRLSAGMIAGDSRISVEWNRSIGWGLPTYILGVPVLLLCATGLLARASHKRGAAGWFMALVTFAALLSSAAGWLVGVIGLAMTIWNE
jgi:hypothetical protein